MALQRVLFPSLGTLKIIFINDAVILGGAVLATIGSYLNRNYYDGEVLLIVGGIASIISLIILLVFTIIDIVKLYKNKVN